MYMIKRMRLILSGKEKVCLPELTFNPVPVKWTLPLSGYLLIHGCRQVILNLSYIEDMERVWKPSVLSTIGTIHSPLIHRA